MGKKALNGQIKQKIGTVDKKQLEHGFEEKSCREQNREVIIQKKNKKKRTWKT